MSIAIVPGTFDPLTIGHDNIIRRSVQLFSNVIIAVTDGGTKQPLTSLSTRLTAIQALYQDNKKIKVVALNGLLVDCAKQHSANVIIRGVRNLVDFEYEAQMANVNHQLSGIDTLFLAPDNNISHISSTIVRDVLKHGGDISAWVPKLIAQTLQGK